MAKIDEQWLYVEYVKKKKSAEIIAKEHNLELLDVQAFVSFYELQSLRSRHNSYGWDN